MNIIVNRNAADYRNETKYLGVVIDSSLSFGSHVDYISNKISKNVGLMYRLAYFVPMYVLLNVYYTLAYPYLIYCNLVWGDSASVHLNKLFLMQKKAVRIITDSDYLANSLSLIHI